jgi:hypothetical protein
VHCIITESESRGCTGEPKGIPQASPSLLQTPPAVTHTGHLKTKKILVRKLSHTYGSSHSCPLKHSLSLVFHKSSLKIATRKTKISPQLHNVWSEFRADPGMGWAPL